MGSPENGIDPVNDDPSDELDINPWPPTELVGRTVVLASLFRRLLLELDQESDEADLFELETQRFDLSAWARVELQTWMTEAEDAVLRSPTGALNDDAFVICEDARHGAVAIAWAIGAIQRAQLPVDEDTELESALLEWAPEPWANVRPLAKRIRIRSDEELAQERERWELWYWRTSLLDEMMTDELREAIRDVAREVSAAGLLPSNGNDFLVNDREVGQLDPDDQEMMLVTAAARLRALNWACGLGDTWESAPLMLD